MDAVAGSNLKIARRANAQARADFATWQMMVKLKSEATLSADARAVLADYNTLRADGIEESVATERTVQALYRRYYADMGGTGEPPTPDSLQPRLAASATGATLQKGAPSPRDGGPDNVMQFRPRPKPTVTARNAGGQPGSRFAGMFTAGSSEPRRIPAWLIFILLVCTIALIKVLLA